MTLVQGTYYHLIALLTVALSLLPLSAAKSANWVETDSSTHYVGTLSMGVAWEQAGQSQTIYLQPDLFKMYTAGKEGDSLMSGELFGGVQKRIAAFTAQLGLELVALSSAQFAGEVFDDANPSLNNFNYRYSLRHSHGALKSKWILQQPKFISPYVFASVGLGINRARGFVIAPNNAESVPPPGFLDKTKTSAVYTFGLGVQADLNKHWQVGVGYELANWGQSALAAAPGQTIGQGLQLNRFYVQQLQCSLSYTV
jgi:opacity protein-like surface antigen